VAAREIVERRAKFGFGDVERAKLRGRWRQEQRNDEERV
jgi:hypothetical protein